MGSAVVDLAVDLAVLEVVDLEGGVTFSLLSSSASASSALLLLAFFFLLSLGDFLG